MPQPKSNADTRLKNNIIPGRAGGGPGARFQGNVVKPQNTIKTLKRLWPYLQQKKNQLMLLTLIIAATTIIGLMGPLLMGIAIDDYIAYSDLKGLTIICLIMLTLYAIHAFTTWLQNYIMIGISQNALKNMRKDVFEKLETLSLKYFDSNAHGDIMSRITNDIENISNTLTNSVTQLISSGLTIIGVIAFMLVLNIKLALVALLVIPFMLIITKFIGKRARKHFKAQQKHLGALNALIEESVSGQKIVKAYTKEESFLDDFDTTNQQLQKASIKAQIYGGIMGPLMNVVNNSNFVIIGLVGGWMTLAGTATIGIMATFINYTRQFGRPLNQLAGLYTTIQSAIAGAERVFEVMDQEPELVDKNNAIILKDLEGSVEFNNVNFGYTKETLILKNIDLTVKPGETIALVGPTGAGKTTIVNLLTRFYDIDSGKILIDGHEIKDVTRSSLRENLGIVLQDTYLFSGTVKDNLLYGKLDATDSEIKKACKLANADQFIHRLPNGYDTQLTKEGTNISQGQRQLLAIARAILADPKILILDEATSSVDTRTEMHIQEAMLNLMQGRTSFVIAHRLSTIKNADMILVINDGEIIERGNHHTLLDKKGFYYNLYNNQFIHSKAIYN